MNTIQKSPLRKVAYTMYPVKDMKRAMDFYAKNLGLTPNLIAAEGAWVEYDLPYGGCFAITTSVKEIEPSATSGGSIAFEVEDLDSLVADLKSNGVQFKLDVFATPVCRIAVILDSEGNAVTLHELKK